MAPADFFWTPYVGLAVLVNTVMFSLSICVHEVMHLATARAYGAPSRISLATRLHHLVVQTDVTAVWGAPRRARYRVYLAGLCWDSFVVCMSTLLIAYAGLPDLADRLLAALALVVLLGMLMQAQVYMRTDLYYVLMEILRSGRLFEDGWDFVRHLGRRVRGRPSEDPSSDLPPRGRRAVRGYAVAMAAGVVVALTVFATYGLPILIEGIVRAFTNIADGLRGGDLVRALDSAAIVAVEGGLQVVFLITFYRRHRHRLTWLSRRAGLQTTES